MRRNNGKFHYDKKNFRQPEKSIGLKVTVFDGNVDQALRKLKKKVANAGLLIELKKREHYEKPTQKRKVKKAMAIKREQKRLDKERLPAKPGYRNY